MTTRPCKIHYRRLARANNQFPALTLAQAISSALDHKLPNGDRISSKVAHRITTVPKNTDYHRFLNHSHQETDLVFGTICLFSPGDMQALLELQEDDKHTALDEVMRAWTIAEQPAPEGMEFCTA